MLVIMLAKFLPPAELGEYGLITVSITFCVLFLGGEFHTYTMREVNTTSPERWSFIIQHQAIAQSILLIILFPLILLLFLFDILSTTYIYWFSILLFLELLNQELHWLLIAMQKQILSSVVMFVRLGLWVFVVLPVMHFNADLNNIQSVLFAWSIGSALAALLGGVLVKKTIPIWKVYGVNKAWIIKGLKIGGSFLLASLALKGLFTFDRFSLELIGTKDELGVYVFYISVIMGMMNFLEPSVFSFIYPKMIQAFHKKQKKKYGKLFNELAITTGLISICLASTVWLLIPHLVHWVNKPIYAEYYYSFNVLLLMGVVYVMGMIPHYGLYAMKRDGWIIFAQLTALIVNIVVILFYTNESPIMIVSVGLLATIFWVGIVKLIGYKLTKRKSFLMEN